MNVYICTIAIHEEPYIMEFVNHYIGLGVDKIVVFDNHPSATLSSLQEHPNVIYIHFPGKQMQLPAYFHMIRMIQSQKVIMPDFVGFFDVDEFLVLRRGLQLKDWLSEFDDFSGVGVPWKLFGSSGLIAYDPRPVMERFTWGARDCHSHFKSFVRPMEVCRINNPHFFETSRGTRNASNTKTLTSAEDPCDDSGEKAVLHHYFTKSYQEYLQKMNRGRSDIRELRSLKDFVKHDINEVEYS